MVNDEVISSRNIQPEDVEALEDAAAQDQEALAIGQAGETIVVNRPAPGQTVEIQAAAGQTYVLTFAPGDAQVEIQGANLVLGFDDNGDGTVDSRVVFLDLAAVAESGNPPTFQVAGTEVGSEVLLSQALALAGQDDAPPEEVAGGPGSLGGGATVYSDDLGSILDLLAAQGVIPPTELQFGLIDLEDEIVLLEEEGENAPPEADPVLTPASQADGGEGGLPPELVEALNNVTVQSATVTVTGSGDAGSVQYVFFTLTEPTAVTITTDGPTIDPHMFLFVDDGSLDAGDVLAEDDDDGLPAGLFSNAVIETGDEIGVLPAGNYIIAVGDFELTLAEAVAGFNDSSSFGSQTGDVTVTVSPQDPIEPSDVVFFKQLNVDSEIGDDDSGVIADFGGADAETALEDLVFTLQSNPTFGQLILVTSGGATSFLTPGDTYTSADTVWWIATQDQIDDFLSQEGAPEFLPDVTFDYSVTDESGASATAQVTITLPQTPPTPPTVLLSLPDQVDCIEEDSATDDPSNQATLTVTPDGDDLLSEIVITGLQGDWTYDFTGLGGVGITVDTSVAGQVTITFDTPSNAAYTGSFAVQPPADSDVDHPPITATATAVDPVNPALSTTGEGTLDVHVDAVADDVTVTITVNDSDGDANDTFQANETGTVHVNATFGDYQDGSETHRVTVMVPAGFLIGALAGLPDGVTFDLSVDGEVTFTIPSGTDSFDYSFEVTAPATVSDGQSFVFEARATADETNTQISLPDDEECDLENNLEQATASDDIYGGVEDIDPVLVVGENADDVENANEPEPHRIDETSDDPVTGEIVGNEGGDVLIGDVGGGNLVGKTMNLALVLDTTGSMEELITFNDVEMMRIQALDLAVEELLQNIADTEGATVRVHMVSFDRDVKKAETFDIIENGVVNDAALQAAKNFILAPGDDPTAVAEGNTNYEAGFNAAYEWFSDNANTLDDPDFNKTIFVSDGEPNRAYKGDTTNQFVGTGNELDDAQDALDHVLGNYDSDDDTHDDNFSEYDALLGEFKGVHGTVDSIGINVDAAALAILDQVDEGDADSITEGQELAEVLDDLTEVTQLAAVGSDVIVGNGGDDLIFGDTLFTDSLAGAEGITSVPGSGWSVIEQLIANGFFGADPAEVNQNIMDFLRDPANQELYDLGGESLTAGGVGRGGGHDSIDGGAGNDTIFGQEGNDTILGGTGDDLIIGGSGDDSMTGGDGSDTFRWTDATQNGEADTITDFQIGAGGDVIDLAGLLTGVPAGADAAQLDAYLDFSTDGTDTTIIVDFDGTGTNSSTITLQNVVLTGIGDDQAVINDLLGSGNLAAE